MEALLAAEDWTEHLERQLPDWAAVFEYEILRGFDYKVGLSSDRASLEMLRKMARTWGSYLGGLLGRVSRIGALFQAVGDMMGIIYRQLPTHLLGEAAREALTPEYLKAQASVEYANALFEQDYRRLREAEEILQASERDLQREIENMVGGFSTEDLGRQMQRLMLELTSFWTEVLASPQGQAKLLEYLLYSLQAVAWLLGYRLRSYVMSHPGRANDVLKALSSRGEVEAAIEEYRWLHGWAGDRSDAVRLGWQALSRKCFRLSPNVDKISEPEDEEKLVGLASGLETYCRDNPAIVSLLDGVSGGLGAYLAKAAKNRESDYLKNLKTDGNRVLTEAKHADDYRSEEEDEERSDDEILSEIGEKFHPAGDPTADQVEAKEPIAAWLRSLTEEERTVVNLKSIGKSQKEIADEMAISQPRVSQLLRQAWTKYQKFR
jgi:RNA polymerase sigma factor (sigma-70 family)